MKAFIPPRAAALVCLGATMISFSAPFVRLAEVPPSVSAFYRMAIGAVILGIWLLRRGNCEWRKDWLFSILLGFLLMLDLWFWHRSILWVGPGVATLLANLQVLILGAAGFWWFREAAGWRFAAGAALALAGLWLLLGQGWSGLSAVYRAGVFFGVAAAIAYALYLLVLRSAQQRRGLSAEQRLLQVSASCALLLGAVALAEGQSLAIPDAVTGMYLVLYALLCQVLGWIFISRGILHLPASVVGLLLLLQPALSILWDVLFFQLRISPAQILGVMLTLGGIYLGATLRLAAR